MQEAVTDTATENSRRATERQEYEDEAATGQVKERRTKIDQQKKDVARATEWSEVLQVPGP